MPFVVGDKVTWSSQASGSWKRKVGEVIEVVAARQLPTKVRNSCTRRMESYVVEVTFPASTRGRAKKPARYWPNVKALKKV